MISFQSHVHPYSYRFTEMLTIASTSLDSSPRSDPGTFEGVKRQRSSLCVKSVLSRVSQCRRPGDESPEFSFI